MRTRADRRKAVRAGKTMPIGGAGVPLAGGLLCVTSHARQEDMRGSRGDEFNVHFSCRNYRERWRWGDSGIKKEYAFMHFRDTHLNSRRDVKWFVQLRKSVTSSTRRLWMPFFFCLFLSSVSCYNLLHFPSSTEFWYITHITVLSASLPSSTSRLFLRMLPFLKLIVVHLMIASSARFDYDLPWLLNLWLLESKRLIVTRWWPGFEARQI